jgi:K+-sensing histidine kinase KdpD
MTRIRRGERVEPYETVRVAKSGQRIDVWLTVSPVHRADGQLIGASAIAHDITERKRLQDSQHLLAVVGTALSASLGNTANLEQVARLSVPTLADQCTIVLRQDDGTIAPVAVAPLDASAVADQVFRSSGAGEQSPIERVIRIGQSALFPDASDGAGNHSARFESLQELSEAGGTSTMIVPLPARGQVMRAMVFTRKDRRYTTQDLALAEEVGRRCALAINNDRLYGDAQEALRLRNEVLASVTHDLKSPLAGISGLAQVLELQVCGGENHPPSSLPPA